MAANAVAGCIFAEPDRGVSYDIFLGSQQWIDLLMALFGQQQLCRIADQLVLVESGQSSLTTKLEAMTRRQLPTSIPEA